MPYYEAEEGIWPSEYYFQQIERLRKAIGQAVYVVEISDSESSAGVSFTSEPRTLLAIVDYPRPDPYRKLCPHLLILDNGRGVNLGYIARISINTPFRPTATDVVFQNHAFMNDYLLAPRRLSRAFLTETSQALLQQMLGETAGRLLQSAAQDLAQLPTLPRKPKSP